MRESVLLQWSLYRRQQRQIAGALAQASPAFKRYERRYRHATRDYTRQVDAAEVARRVVEADVVYVGDYHTLKQAQDAYLALMQAALSSGRRVVLALEFVEGRHQASLDAYLQGRLGEKAFLKRIGHPYRGPFDIWPHFAPIFELAKRRRLEVLAIDRRASGEKSLDVRDGFAAGRIAEAARAKDQPLVLVLMGQYHVAPGHLPRAVRQRMNGGERSHLVVYQNAERVYWRLLDRGLADDTHAVALEDGSLCLVNASPLECQRSFLDYVEAELGDAPLEERGLSRTFRQLAQAIGAVAGVKAEREARRVEVITAGTLSQLSKVCARARYSPKEIRVIEKHVLSRESAYLPRARAVWLGSLSINHAAEEASHFVRHLAVGDAMDAPRPVSQAFWARCLEEALGFFGAKLVNPTRRCVQVKEWAGIFETAPARQRQIAAFVLALVSTEVSDGDRLAQLVPRGDVELFNAVSHALGYLLGEALYRAFDKGAVSQAQVAALYADPFAAPLAAYSALWLMLEARTGGKAASARRAA